VRLFRQLNSLPDDETQEGQYSLGRGEVPSREMDMMAPARGVARWQVRYRMQGRKVSHSMRKREVWPAQ